VDGSALFRQRDRASDSAVQHTALESIYRRRPSFVNRRRAADVRGAHLGRLAWFGWVVAMCGGCSVPRVAVDNGPYLIAVRYDVEPRLLGLENAARVDRIQRDLQAITGMGFNTVMLRHVEEAESASLRVSAAECGLRCLPLPVGGEKVEPRVGGWAILDTAALDSGAAGSPLEGILAQYHAGLSAGQTEGVVVDRFFRFPGDPPGLASADDAPLTPARRAAIDELIQRARSWGPRIHQLQPLSNTASVAASEELKLTTLVRGRRVYFLLVNTSTERYARCDVFLPEKVQGMTVSRVVEVPAAMDRGAGRVIHAQRGRITLPVTLRPCDAALFEVFGVQR